MNAVVFLVFFFFFIRYVYLNIRKSIKKKHVVSGYQHKYKVVFYLRMPTREMLSDLFQRNFVLIRSYTDENKTFFSAKHNILTVGVGL